MAITIKILQLILALSVLILVHELGHFTFAKIFKIRVEKFYLFFDAGGFKLFSTKSKWFIKLCPKAAEWETEYGIGWLPLGGYCKIAGMIDESMDTEQMKSEPQPWEFRTKAAWKRLLVMVGGVLFNFIFAIILFIAILAIWGEAYISNEDKQIYVNELASELGFRNGDHIISYDDEKQTDFMQLHAGLARDMVKKVTVKRGEDTLDIYIDNNKIHEILSSKNMFDIAIPYIVEDFTEDSPNKDCGLQKGDRIIEIGDSTCRFFQDAKKLISKQPGKDIVLKAVRDNDTLSFTLHVNDDGLVGIYPQAIRAEWKEYGLLEAIPAGFRKTYTSISDYLKDLKLVATPSTEAYKSVGSFISIGKIFPSEWNWYGFTNILALLSIMLGVMNLLPIPALDGGRIVFTLYEMITRKKPSDRFLYIAQIIGMILLFGLMFLACGNDIASLI